VEPTESEKAARLLHPVRITEQDWPEGTVPVVSIFCITYNHERFIRDAIEGFLVQETTFPVEIFVHDDASTDGTAEIIKEYAEKHPQLFWTVLQKENQWSNGNKNILFDFLLDQRGDFTALCEGDDRWVDLHKLQTQYEYLQSHTDCSGCFHQTSKIDAGNNIINEKMFFGGKTKYSLSDCITIVNSAYATCSLMFKSQTLLDPPLWLRNDPCDMMMELQIARFGDLAFIDENMAQYRIHQGGIWNSMNPVMHLFHAMHRLQCLLEISDFQEFRPAIEFRIKELSERLITIEELARRVEADRIARRPWNRLAKNVRRILRTNKSR
jgi:glycosyltransferase involved in cell wall biosynthesis